MRRLIEKNYKYRAAGRTWLVPKLHLKKMPDGTVAISQDEIDRIHKAIANQICGSSEVLSFVELEFLCDVSETSFYEVAKHIGMHKSTPSKWRKIGTVPNHITSIFLKRWFWFKLFGQVLSDETIKLKDLRDEIEFLTLAKSHAIGQRFTVSVRELATGITQ